MSTAELDAAGIADPALRASYRRCRALNASHGRTYYLATRLLPARRRPAVHALYAFARHADEIVDDLGSTQTARQKADELGRWGRAFVDALRAGPDAAQPGDDPILPAVLDAAWRYDIDAGLFEAFLRSMQMDLTIDSYATYDDLREYMWGSAAVIGLQMLPVLGLVCPRPIAEPYAADLGCAFQLTNFLRDVGEDLARGRIYLPQDSLARFGVDRERLARGVVDEPIRRLLQCEIARARALYRDAEPGIRLVEPSSRRCLRLAWTLYRQILDEIERADYQVLDRRVSVGLGRRALAVGRELAAERSLRR
ncbi:MAG: phytoene/squalene synthase family protein [Frankiaceae bacterium]|nr:phytoene/squalene synthase family protein [Frankiaceae bacterium]